MEPIKPQLLFSKFKTQYLLVYFAIAFSGIIVFDEWKIGKIIFFIILSAIFIHKKKKFDHEMLPVITAALILIGYNVFFWGESYFFILTFIVYYILPPYFILKIVGWDYYRYYINIMYYYSIVGLFFWLSTSIVPGFLQLTYGLATIVSRFASWAPNPESYILYNYEEIRVGMFIRSPGPFHEAGAFCVFLVMALFLNIMLTKKLNNKKNVIFIVSILSTFSTAGYVALFVLILSYFPYSGYNKLLKVCMMLIMFASIIYVYDSAEFLSNKISYQYENDTSRNIGEATSGRIFSLRKAIISIENYPLLGKGLYVGSRGQETDSDYSGYGWPTWVARIGIPLGILYFYFIFLGIKNISILSGFSGRYAFWGFLSLMIVLFPQKHFSSYAVFILLYYGVLLRQKKKIIPKKRIGLM